MDFCEGPPFYGFQSFSYGYRIRFGKEYKNYFFVDMQKGNYLGGAGVGLAFWKNKDSRKVIMPRWSVFGLFITYDRVISDEINRDVGVQMIFPTTGT